MDYENQKMLEEFFNARQTMKLLRHQFSSDQNIFNLIKKAGLPQDFGLDLLSQMALHKRANVPTLVGLLSYHYDGQFQVTADALQIAAERDLVDFDTNTDQFVLRFDVDASTHALIRQYQYLPPMIIPPLEVKSNRGSGYVTIRHDSLILKDNHHEGDICLDSINRFNKIPLCINERIVKGIRNSWRGLDKAKADETFEEYQKRVKAFERYERDSFHTIALMLEMGNRFHMTHKVDKRGRTYSQGYHVNPQGNVWNKAVVELADKELVK